MRTLLICLVHSPLPPLPRTSPVTSAWASTINAHSCALRYVLPLHVSTSESRATLAPAFSKNGQRSAGARVIWGLVQRTT